MPRYWADLHNHNSIGYGQGSMERSYAIARSMLDVYAFTPHGYWADPPLDEPHTLKKHTHGFQEVSSAWERVVLAANTHNREVEFVSFVAHEWHSTQWGDFCIYFPGDSGELIRASDPEDLKKNAHKTGALLLPHHCGYATGRRSTDWSVVEEELSPLAEIFSEHGNSLEPVSPLGLYRHSMGGSQYSQTVNRQIEAGRKIGFIAGTDNHYGHPGSYGEGLTAVIADNLSRQEIMAALQARHTYAVTGDRIEIDIKTDTGHTMGDILPKGVVPKIELFVQGHTEIDYVQLLCNGKPIDTKTPNPTTVSNTSSNYYLRLEFGWGGMESKNTTKWKIALSLDNGFVEELVPYFSSGPNTVDTVNKVHKISKKHIEIHAVSNRTNLIPTQSVLIEMSSIENSNLHYEIMIEENGVYNKKNGVVHLKHLFTDDVHVHTSDAFSTPMCKFHRVLKKTAAQLQCEWKCRPVSDEDSYYVKVVQKNGHMAWTSPLWLRK